MRIVVRTSAPLLILTTLAAAHPIAEPPFAFICRVGTRSAQITTEAGVLVYRFGAGQPERTVRGSAAAGNLFALREIGPRSEYQQLRFVNGGYSYVLASLFVAPDYDGRGAQDRVDLVVLAGKRVVARHRCRDASSFEDYDQLDGLPRDPIGAVAD